MRGFGSYLTASTLLIAFTVTSFAQQTQPLSKSGMAAKQKIESLDPQSHITVVPAGASKEYGNLLSHDQETFTFYNVDQKQNVTLRYDDVKKIKNGYGGYNHFVGRHTDPTRRIVYILVFAGVLGAVVVAAAASK